MVQYIIKIHKHTHTIKKFKKDKDKWKDKEQNKEKLKQLDCNMKEQFEKLMKDIIIEYERKLKILIKKNIRRII